MKKETLFFDHLSLIVISSSPFISNFLISPHSHWSRPEATLLFTSPQLAASSAFVIHPAITLLRRVELLRLGHVSLSLCILYSISQNHQKLLGCVQPICFCCFGLLLWHLSGKGPPTFPEAENAPLD